MNSIESHFTRQVQARVRDIASPAQTDVRYQPPDLKIKTRQADMDVDMTHVFEDWGALRPSSFRKEIENRAEKAYVQGVTDEVRNGRRIRDIHKESGNVYGQIAFQTYMRGANREVVLDALPKQPAKIDIRIHPPEIDFEMKTVVIGLPKGN